MNETETTTHPPHYDGLTFRGNYHRTIAEKEEEFVVQHLLPGRRRVLEVGPGSGRFTRHLAQLAERLDVCDLHQEILDGVRNRIVERKRLHFHLTPLEAIPDLSFFGDFDAAVAVRVAPLTNDWRRSIALLCEAVRPGGLVFFDLWNRRSFVGLVKRIVRRQEPVEVHCATASEMRDAIRQLPVEQVATLRWGYPRFGGLHLDTLGGLLLPSCAWSTLYCLRRTEGKLARRPVPETSTPL